MRSIANGLMLLDETSLVSSKLKLSVIVVTYGKRWSLLRNVIYCLETDDLVNEIVIVDNASHYNVKVACLAEHFQKVILVEHVINIGSAGGFVSGITIAIDRGADFIFLLDDDNLPLPDTIPKLLNTYSTERHRFPEPIAIAAYRKCQYDSFWNMPQKIYRSRDDFMGFNVFNALQRHFSICQQHNAKSSGPEYFNAKRCGPFSGMFFHTHLIKAVGLPRQDMVIYYDDVEWVIRILNCGGTVWLDTEAIIEEQNSNYAVSIFNRPVLGMILADSDSKVYYLIRNRTYIDVFIEKKSGIFYMVNKFSLIGMLLIGSLLLGKVQRMVTVFTAYRDGSKGNLGMNSRYRLT